MQGGPAHSKPRAVSFASEVSTIPTLSTTSAEDGSPECSPRATLTTLGSTMAGSEDITSVSKDFLSVSTCDEVCDSTHLYVYCTCIQCI